MSGRVISISGPPGAGKSLLAEGLAERLGAALVSYDAFETFTRLGPDVIVDWLARDAPYGEISTPGLAAAIQDAAARGDVVLDTPLGRAHPDTGQLIDRAFWIDCPADLALSRKIAQLAQKVPAQRAADFLVWLRGYLAQYELIVRPACAIQGARVRPTCDTIIDARQPVDKILSEVTMQLLKGKSVGV